MRLFVLAASLLAPAVLAAQDASYVIRLGKDTVGLERVTRSANKVTGEYVMRSPRPVHALYTIDLNADGTVKRFELISHNISGAPGVPAETKFTADLAGDSATLVIPRGDSSVTQRVAAGPGTVFWLGYPVAMYEQMARQGRTATARYSVPFLGTGNLRGTAHVSKGTGDTLHGGITLSVGEISPIKMTLDRGGRLNSLSAVGTPIQIEVERVPSVDIDAAAPAFANRPLGQLSLRDTVEASVGDARLAVEYSRPMKRGREIFGNVVPWNAVWRTGANAATHFRTPVDLTIGGALVPAGSYTLWTLPSPTGWKLIINRQTGQWGTSYDAARDLVRVDMQVETLPQPVEQMTIAIDGGMLRVEWDRTRASVPVTR